MKTLVVIPAYNEQDCVAHVIAEVFASGDEVRCLVVDDGSSDNTVREALSAGALVASLPYNLGVGGAMSVGFKYALENNYKNVVQIDADGQHNPSDLSKLLAGLAESDIVIGARFAGKDGYNVSGPRRWAMWVLGKSLSMVSGSALTDVTSGYKAMGPRAVMLFAHNYPAEYLGDTVEALVIASRAGCTISQVPVVMRERQGGSPSHGPFKAAIYLGRAVFALLIALIKPKSQIADIRS